MRDELDLLTTRHSSIRVQRSFMPPRHVTTRAMARREDERTPEIRRHPRSSDLVRAGVAHRAHRDREQREPDPRVHPHLPCRRCPVAHRKRRQVRSRQMAHTRGAWRKSPYSTCNGNCVEIAARTGDIIATARTPRRPMLRFTPDEWHDFLSGVKHGDFDGLG